MALDIISDYVFQTRVIVQDQVQPYRYPDADLVAAFNIAVMESKRLRPDLWLNVATLPSFTYAQTSVATPSGNVLNFAFTPPGLNNAMQVYNITNPAAIPATDTVNFFTTTQVTLTGNITSQVNAGDLIAFIAPASVPAIDPMYRMAFVYYMCGQAQMRDEEETEDNRALAFLKLFQEKLMGL